MNPRIGTKYLRMSLEGLFLDSASLARLQQVAIGKKPDKPNVRDPQTPSGKVDAETEKGKLLTRRYLAAVDSAAKRRHQVMADWEAFCHCQFFERNSKIVGYPDESKRIYALVDMDAGEHYVDIVTGSIFTDSGECLSSVQIRAEKSQKSVSRKSIVTYLKSRETDDIEEL